MVNTTKPIRYGFKVFAIALLITLAVAGALAAFAFFPPLVAAAPAVAGVALGFSINGAFVGLGLSLAFGVAGGFA